MTDGQTESRIPKDLDFLESAFGDLSGSLDSLRLRLAPVSRPGDQPKTGTPVDPKTIGVSMSPMASKVGRYIERVKDMQQQVAEMLERLEV